MIRREKTLREVWDGPRIEAASVGGDLSQGAKGLLSL